MAADRRMEREQECGDQKLEMQGKSIREMSRGLLADTVPL